MADNAYWSNLLDELWVFIITILNVVKVIFKTIEKVWISNLKPLVTFPNEILKSWRIKNIDIIWYYMKSYDFQAWRGLSYLIKLGLITKYIYPICKPLPYP